MAGAKSGRETPDNLVVGAALARRLDQLATDLQVAVAARLIQIVVFEEHGGGQHDVGPARRLGHELLVHCDEQVVPPEAAADAVAVRAHGHRVLVLDQHGMDLRPVAEFRPVSGEHAADAAHVEHADRRVDPVQSLNERLVELIDRPVGPERTAALVLPGAGDGRQTGHGVHVRRSVCGCGQSRSRNG